jgi:dipeptidase E
MQILGISLDNTAVADFFRATSHAPRIAFVPTAGNVYEDPYFVVDDRDRLVSYGLELVDVDLDIMDSTEVLDELQKSTGIYVAGGNTFHLLCAIEKLEIRDGMAEIIRSGKPYAGASAGAVILADDIAYVGEIDDAGAAPGLKSTSGLGIIKFRPLPHFGKEKYLEKYFTILRGNLNAPYVLLRDDQVFATEDGVRVTVGPAN